MKYRHEFFKKKGERWRKSLRQPINFQVQTYRHSIEVNKTEHLHTHTKEMRTLTFPKPFMYKYWTEPILVQIHIHTVFSIEWSFHGICVSFVCVSFLSRCSNQSNLYSKSTLERKRATTEIALGQLTLSVFLEKSHSHLLGCTMKFGICSIRFTEICCYWVREASQFYESYPIYLNRQLHEKKNPFLEGCTFVAVMFY